MFEKYENFYQRQHPLDYLKFFKESHSSVCDHVDWDGIIAKEEVAHEERVRREKAEAEDEVASTAFKSIEEMEKEAAAKQKQEAEATEGEGSGGDDAAETATGGSDTTAE